MNNFVVRKLLFYNFPTSSQSEIASVKNLFCQIVPYSQKVLQHEIGGYAMVMGDCHNNIAESERTAPAIRLELETHPVC